MINKLIDYIISITITIGILIISAIWYMNTNGGMN